MRFGYHMGYWSAGPPPAAQEAVLAADRLGFDSVWTAEAYGSDALTPLAWWGSRTERIRLGTAIAQISARTPTAAAMAALTMDHLSGGRFVLGLGAGWHEGEHLPFGIPLPPMPERFDRFESAVHVIKAMFSDAAAQDSGVSRPDRFYSLDGATNLPAPLTRGGPPIWLGGQKRRGLALVAAHGDGWMLPAIPDFDIGYFSEKRDGILAAMEAAGRDSAGFAFAAQVQTGTTAESRRAALGGARAFIRAGATHMILGLPARLGPDGLTAVASEIANPLRDAAGG